MRAMLVEREKKKFDIQTYQEIIAFTEGKSLSEIEKAREEGNDRTRSVSGSRVGCSRSDCYAIFLVVIGIGFNIKDEGKEMRFIIEHLEKHFDKKEVLKDIDFTFEEGKDLRSPGAQWARERLRCLIVSTGIFKAERRKLFAWKKAETRREVEPEEIRLRVVNARCAGVPDRT